MENVGRVRDALKCYKRAEAASDREGIAVQRMADIYRSLGMADEVGVSPPLRSKTTDASLPPRLSTGGALFERPSPSEV